MMKLFLAPALTMFSLSLEYFRGWMLATICMRMLKQLFLIRSDVLKKEVAQRIHHVFSTKRYKKYLFPTNQRGVFWFSPENRWLEDKFSLWDGIFSGAIVAGGVYISLNFNQQVLVVGWERIQKKSEFRNHHLHHRGWRVLELYVAMSRRFEIANILVLQMRNPPYFFKFCYVLQCF